MGWKKLTVIIIMQIHNSSNYRWNTLPSYADLDRSCFLLAPTQVDWNLSAKDHMGIECEKCSGAILMCS